MHRILLIDSDPGGSRLVRSCLAQAGFNVASAESGAKGLVEARSSEFDAICLAAELGDGIPSEEVSRRIKGIPQLSGVPLVVYTQQSARPEWSERVYGSGGDLFVDRSQVDKLDRVLTGLLGMKGHQDELIEENRNLLAENRRLQEQWQRRVELDATTDGASTDALMARELAAERPDGVLVVDGLGRVLSVDRGACELLGVQIEGRNLGSIAPSSGLEAFVRDARSTARSGFRFDAPARRGRAGRSLLASVVPVTGDEGASDSGARVVLLLDVGKRRVADEILRSQEPGISRYQLGALVEAARRTFSPEALLGSGPAGQTLRARVLELRDQTGPVLIQGERGSGKEFVARTLHYGGSATGAFLQLHCGALAPNSIEDELFGYVKGAFEGAIADRPGLLTLAQDGTLLLEEIADLSLESQRKLLESFETRSVLRKGRDRREPVEVRVVASTSADLGSLAASGRFLPGLLAKFATTIRIPPLRDRAEDIQLFAARFIDRFRGDRPITGTGQRALWVMQRYSWPGNLAELQDCVEQACRRTKGSQIEVDALPRSLRDLEDELPSSAYIPSIRPAPVLSGAMPAVALMGTAHQRSWDITDDDPVSLALYEKKALLRALDACGGDKLAAARLLRVGKSTLYRKLKRFDIR